MLSSQMSQSVNRVQDVTFEVQPLKMNQMSEQRRLRKEALDKLDNAKFGCFHIRACVVSGIGFLTVIDFYFSSC
jgi:hypothetical protein